MDLFSEYGNQITLFMTTMTCFLIHCLFPSLFFIYALEQIIRLLERSESHLFEPRSLLQDPSSNIINTFLPCHEHRTDTQLGKRIVCLEKQRRRKRDRMIFNFWIPLFLVLIALLNFKLISVNRSISTGFGRLLSPLIMNSWSNYSENSALASQEPFGIRIAPLGFG
jgi:hypothetical protein